MMDNNANKLEHGTEGNGTGDGRLASLLRPVRADLVNSCGAADLCLVEGDSVVAEALGDSSLDWTSGGQFLHLTFLVEKYLLDMRERGVSYRVVFIDSNRALWEQSSSQLLGRELIYRHLKFNSDFDIDCIPSWLNSSALQAEQDSRPEAGLWDEYLAKHNPSFVLLTDGGKLPQSSALIVQGLIVDCLRRDINVVFSQLDFQSRQVYGFLVRPSPDLLQFRSRVVERTLAAGEARAQGFDKDSLASLLPRFGLRQTIFFLAFTSALEDNRASADPRDWEALGKIYLLHLVLLAHLPLKARAQRLGEADDQSALQQVITFLSSVHGHSIAWLQECDAHLESVAANGTVEAKCILAELADFADGRLFFKVLDLVTNNAKQLIEVEGLTTVLGFTPAMVEETLNAWHQICLIQGQEAGLFFPLSSGHNLTRSPAKDHSIHVEHQLQMVSCSFTRAVLGDELADKLNVREAQEGESTQVAHKNSHPYVENYHWHSGRSLEADHRQHGEYDVRATQKYLKFVHTYAESLEGTIVHHTGGSTGPAVESAANTADVKGHKAPKQTNNKKGASRKQQMCDTNAAKRMKEAEEAARTKLETVCTRALGAQALNDIDTFILNCPVKHVALEAQLKKLAIYLQQHRNAELEHGDNSSVEDREKNTKVAIFGLAQHVCEHYTALLDSSVSALLADSLTWAGFPDAAQSLRDEFNGTVVQDTPVAKAAKPKPTTTKVAAPKAVVPMAADIRKVRRMLDELSPLKSTPAIDFQLDKMGHLLSRKSLGSRSDPRVTFTPDEWQIKLLDVVDKKGSALVCAPTSSGKTFISYYCMEKVLNESEDGVVVYVSPTKALVNQVAAEVYARFRTKSCGTQSVFGMFTRDYRYKPLNCRILVTVPACLEIFLLSPQNRSWVSRLRYVIFDEVHSIANPAEGPTWERLLLLINCPFLALSATVGNPSTFHQWLVAIKSHQRQQFPAGQQPTKPKRGAKSGQASQQDFDVALISHHERYSDLAKRVFAIPPGTRGEEPQATPFIKDLHPYVALNLTRMQKRGFPKDLTLEPRQCLQLYNAMVGSVTEHPLDDLLAKKLQQASPATYFKRPHAISRHDVREYEQALREIFVQLSKPSARAVLKLLDPDTRVMSKSLKGETVVDQHIFPLLTTLKQQNRLPAIFFTLDRDRCEDFATTVTDTLQRLTKAAIDEVQGSEKDVKQNEKMVERHRKAARSKRDKDAKDAKKDQDASGDQPETRDPSDFLHQKIRDIVMRHSFGEPGKQLPEHVYQRLMFRIKRGLDPEHILVKALQYGVGVHHAGLPTSYRQAVEWLFRVGALRVVFATGTLALGIHMPCKTVVFAEDSIHLDSLAFRQMSGRAGRRGHDLLGHVLFFGLPYSKVQRLLTADLTRIRGEFPVNASLVLRCMILHHQLNGSEPECVPSLTRLFHRPLFSMDNDPTNLLVRLHFRYSVEYLIETGLLSPQGAPLDYSGLVAHLSWTEPANFLFLTLLTRGVFKRICDPIANCKAGSPAEMEVLKEMMLVMCHLFERRTLHPAVLGTDFAKLGPSKVVLEDLPGPIAKVLEEHNTRALRLFSSCARDFAAKLAPEASLPASKLTIPLGAKNHSQPTATVGLLDAGSIRYHVRSPFIATSGHGDHFTSVDELEREVRTQAYIHRSAIPTLSQRGIRNTKLLLNRYALDFLSHGQFKAMAKANGLVGGEAWDCLYSFSLILKTISMALRKLSCPEEEFKRLIQDEDEWGADPLRRVSDDPTVQAFFRLSTVFALLLQQHQRR